MFYLAAALNRLLWAIRKNPKLLPKKYHRWTPLIAIAWGVLYGIGEATTLGTGIGTGILTGLGAAGAAVGWREVTRMLETPAPDALVSR